MRLKFNSTGLTAFLLLGGCVYLWGPGWQGLWRAAGSLALYAAVFAACFVVIQGK